MICCPLLSLTSSSLFAPLPQLQITSLHCLSFRGGRGGGEARPVHTCSSSFFFPVPGEEERGKPPPSLAWGSVHMTFEVGLPLHLGSIVYSLKQPVFLLIADIICKCPLPSSSVLPMPPSPPFHHPSIFSWPSCSPPSSGFALRKGHLLPPLSLSLLPSHERM